MIRKLMTEKRKFFSSFWNVVDFITAILSLLAIAFYGGRTVHANTALSKITADINKGKLLLTGTLTRILPERTENLSGHLQKKFSLLKGP